MCIYGESTENDIGVAVARAFDGLQKIQRGQYAEQHHQGIATGLLRVAHVEGVDGEQSRGNESRTRIEETAA